jgi:hypothetical protein
MVFESHTEALPHTCISLLQPWIPYVLGIVRSKVHIFECSLLASRQETRCNAYLRDLHVIRIERCVKFLYISAQSRFVTYLFSYLSASLVYAKSNAQPCFVYLLKYQ